MPGADEVLVALIPNPADLKIAREQHWYRLPVASASKMLKDRWPPSWIAFYQPKAFGDMAFSVRYYAQVYEIREASRRELFPDQPRHPHADWQYYQLMLSELHPLAAPIPSLRLRRIVFIPTTWRKLVTANEINDLFDTDPLDDLLWLELRRLGISAERQEFVAANGRDYALDFAIYCQSGNLNVETDGDGQNDAARAHWLTQRDNDLAAQRWRMLRFNTYQINEELEQYCIPNIVRSVVNLGGLDTRRVVPRPADKTGAGG